MLFNIKQNIYRPYAILKIKSKFRKYKCTSSEPTRLFLLNIPSHGNLGDHLLSVAEHEFFKDNYPNMKLVPVTSSDLYYSCKCALSTVRPNDILCITGGGFLGSLYDEEERFLKILEMFPHNKIIVLPQTIYYEGNTKGKKALEKAVSQYQSHKKLFVVARDQNSYNLLVNVLMKGRTDKVALVPDLALYLNRQSNNERKGVLWCMRSDKEINNSNRNIIASIQAQVNTLNIDEEYTDTYVSYSVPYESELNEVKKKLLQFSNSRIVITDRLHGMIYSVITGTPVIAMDNISGKVGQVYKQWLSNLHFVRFVATEDEANNLVNNMLNIGDCFYDNSHLIKLYQPIIDFINA